MSDWERIIKHNGVDKVLHVHKVSGAGSRHFHVLLDRRYMGSIWETENYGWQHSVEHPAITPKMVARLIDLIELGEI